MEAGTHCNHSSCGRLSFLPITCPYCRTAFCESHFLPEQHECKAPGALSTNLTDIELAKRYARSHPASSAATHNRLPCQKRGCKRYSLELSSSTGTGANGSTASNAARESSSSVRVVDGAGGSQSVGGGGSKPFTHSAPRCDRCRGLFCVMHRSAVAHGCSAPAPPTEGQARIRAAEERKKKAAEVLAKHFPNRRA